MAPKKTIETNFNQIPIMGVWGRFGSPKKTVKNKRSYIWDSINTNNIKIEFNKNSNSNFEVNSKSQKWFKKRKSRKSRKYLERIPKKYSVYIKSPWWTRRKNLYFQKFGKRCVIDGRLKFIQLHHLHYKDLGIEEDRALVALCKECHNEFHRLYGVKAKMYKEFEKFKQFKFNSPQIIK